MLVDVEGVRLLREVVRAYNPTRARLLLLRVPTGQKKALRQYDFPSTR